MQTRHFDKIDETLITEVLPNGLSINIIPKPAFSKGFAMCSKALSAALSSLFFRLKS